jgi:hypothetical protein
MVPLIKRSVDNLVAVMEEKAAAEVTFEAIEYVGLLISFLLYIKDIFFSHARICRL